MCHRAGANKSDLSRARRKDCHLRDSQFLSVRLKFSIITPSFRNSAWLKRCIASVADQEGLEHEHIVQDSCSDDGTQEWLPHDPRVRAFVEKDGGMYDAVNRGLRRASGDVLAYLNCDEQYLPGALSAVGDYFERHPDVDVVLPDTVIVNPAGEYLCHRYSLVPRADTIWIRFPVLTCSLFFRRRVIDELGIFFDPKWRDLGDMFFIMEMARRGVRMAALRCFGSVFTETGENMNLKPNALREKVEKRALTPRWVKLLEPAILLQYRLRLLFSGAFHQPSFDYALYALDGGERRVAHHVARPTARWPGRY